MVERLKLNDMWQPIIKEKDVFCLVGYRIKILLLNLICISIGV